MVMKKASGGDSPLRQGAGKSDDEVGALVEDRYVGGIGSGDNQKEGKDDAKTRIHGA
jgi:hypothetical protein